MTAVEVGPEVGGRRTVLPPAGPFEHLEAWPYEARYAHVDGLRMHYVDEGPPDAAPIVLLHGLPAWSYLYRHMIPPLVAAGHRVLAPDLIGFGRSEKPTRAEDYTLINHVNWLTSWFEAVDVRAATVVCHDWGGLIGLRVVTEQPWRGHRLVLFDTSLNDGRETFSPQYLAGLAAWTRLLREEPVLRPGLAVQNGTTRPLSEAAVYAYEAPFPNEDHRAGFRINDSLYPLTPDAPGAAGNADARQVLADWPHPVLICFSGAAEHHHPGMHRIFSALFPPEKMWRDSVLEGTRHFLQEDRGPELAKLVHEFIGCTPGASESAEPAEVSREILHDPKVGVQARSTTS